MEGWLEPLTSCCCHGLHVSLIVLFPITGTGEKTRDFTYVGDLVDGFLRAGYFEEAVGQSFLYIAYHLKKKALATIVLAEV